MRWLWVVLLVGCGPQGKGGDKGDNGAVLDAVGACEAQPGDGDVDLQFGCWGDLCLGQDRSVWLDEFGPCEDLNELTSSGYCDWDRIGLEITYELDTGRVRRFELFVGSGASTRDDLGPGSTVGCFIDGLGDPNEVDFERVDQDWFASRAEWDDLGVTVHDRENTTGQYVPDGVVDILEVAAP